MMAVDGKNASGRLAAGTVLWLLVAIFANQDFVYCDGQQPRLEPQSFLPLPLQEEKQQPKIPIQIPQPIQPQMSQQLPKPPTTPQQQQQQQQLPQQQQLRLPSPPQELGMLGPINNMVKDMQPNINRLSEQSMNSDFGTNPQPPQLQQQLSNVANPSNMPGGGRIPMYSGSSFTGPPMQASGPIQMPTYDETNQGVNTQSRLSSQSESNPNLAPLMTNPSSGLDEYIPPPGLTGTNSMQLPLNNMQNSMNGPQHMYPQSIPQSVHYLPNDRPHPSPRPFMGQQRPHYTGPYYPNSNVNEPTASVNTPGFPGQSYLNMNMGNLLQPAQKMFTNLNPMEFVQKPIGMALNAVGQLSKYGGSVKNDLTRAFGEVVGQILNQGQTGMHRVLDMGLNGGNAVFDFSRSMLLPNSRSQQPDNTDVNYNSQPNRMQSFPGSGQLIDYNNGQPTPAQAGAPYESYNRGANI